MKLSELFTSHAPIPSLSSDLIHVWSFAHSLPAANFATLEKLLSPEERARASRFHFERDRNSFILCRGLLRILLGHYLSAEPESLEFQYGPHSKPHLANPSRPEPHFSISHSAERGLLAFSLHPNVGVDIEFMRGTVDISRLAERSFSESEAVDVQALPPSQQMQRFYEYWSCKEACIKADGRGLSVPLRSFSIVRCPNQPQWRNVEITGEDSISAQMRVRILQSPPQYAAAVAAPGPHWDILIFLLEE